jgi:hypothetical protein
MISKNQSRLLYYLDRDTDVPALVDRMLRARRVESIQLLERLKLRLQEKQAGEYYTVEDRIALKDGELEKMMRFYRGAVVPYFFRQSYDHWEEEIPRGAMETCHEEVKTAVGFMRYDHTGHITKETNSLATFERVRDFNEFLTHVEAVCFQDRALIFPDSEHFLKLEKEKGRAAAQRQVFEELLEKHKNRFAGREPV